MRISLNAPVILGFSLAVVALRVLDALFEQQLAPRYFVVHPGFRATDPWEYFRLFSHILGHTDWSHLLNNLTYVLLLGPILEDRYGSLRLLLMMLATALVVGLLNSLLFATALMGASSIVFMLITLLSLVDMKAGSIPLTHILVVGLFFGTELLTVLETDNISQMAHIAGGVSGAIFGYLLADRGSRRRVAKRAAKTPRST